MSIFSLLRSAAAAVLLCAALDAAASAGLIQFSAGDVKVRNAAGQLRAAVKGGTVDEGDTILTASGASAQIKMADGGIIAVRPETELKVDTYRYAGKEDGNERAVMSLVKGGFRTITGIIGRTNKQNYTVNTPTATIGIRGTDHEPVVIPAIVNAGKTVAPPGTYDKVNVGQAFIRTPLGEVNIRQNQVGYAAPNQAPTLLPKVPEFFKATPPVRQAQASKEEQQKQEQQKQGEQKQAEQKQEQQKQQTGQAASGEKTADTQATQTASSTSSTDSGSTSTTGTGGGTSSAASSTGSEIRSVATVDATPSTASTGAAATTTAIVPTTATVATVVTTTTPAGAPPAVVQEIKAKSSDETAVTLDLTTQTTTSSTGTTTPITQDTSVTSVTSTTTTPSIAATTYGSVIMSQAPVDVTTQELEGVSTELQSNTAYVIDNKKALLEVQHTGHVRTNNQGVVQKIADANLKFSGGKTEDIYVDPTSTLYIGRQEGGSIKVTDNSGAISAFTQSLNSSSAHWLVGVQPAQVALPGGVGSITNVQNVVGTAHYALTAATHPTDLKGNVGTLSSALFFADFSAQTVGGVMGVLFSTTDSAVRSTRDFELLAIASNVPIRRGGFDATAGTSTAPFVVCVSGDCVERSYRGTIRGMFGSATGGAGGIGTGLGIGYSFAPEATTSSFEDLVQGTAVLSMIGTPPSGGIQHSFARNDNVRHELFYGTFQKASSTNANFAVARDTMTLVNTATQTLSGPRTNSNYLFDASGNLVRIYDTPYAVFDHGANINTATGFTAPTPIAHAQISMGGLDATAADLYADSALGLRMGRWRDGTLNVTDLATGAGYVEELGGRSVHWLVRTAPTSLPVTGVYHYSRVAATQPTDMYGNVGTLDRARLEVDFNRSTVSAGVAVSMPSGFGGDLGSQSLTGYFTDVPLTGSAFNVSSNASDNPANTDRLHVHCTGSGCAPNQTYGGRLRGGFSTGTATANTAEGAYLRYTFVTNYGSATAAEAEGRVFDDYIDGFVAFKQGAEIAKPSIDISGSPTSSTSIVKPAGDASIVYAYNYLSSSFPQSRMDDVYAEGGKGYEVDGSGRLVSVKGYFDDDRSISVGSATSGVADKRQVGTGNNAFEIAYGYYVQPTVSGQESSGSFNSRVADTLHWVRGPAIYPFYLSMITENPANLSGSSPTVGYTTLGGRVNDAGSAVGTVDTAFSKLAVNFSAQTVDAAVKATVGSGSGTSVFEAVANRMALEDLGSFWASSNGPVQHNFASTGSKLTVTSNNTTISASGSLRGALMGPGLQGAGLVFDFSSSSARATGSVVFGDPKYTDVSGTTVPFSASTLADYHLGMVASGMNKTGSFTNVIGGGTLEQQNNYRVDLGALPPTRARFESQTVNNVVLPVLTRFDGVSPFGYGCSSGVCSGVTEIGARFSIDTASSTSAKVLEAGYDASTGVRWGRWGGGLVTVGDRASGGTGSVPSVDGSTTTTTTNLTANHWHYLLTGVQSGPVVLPVTGTATYQLVGATSPTAYSPNQSVPIVGVLDKVTTTLRADFGAKTVDVAVNLTMPGNDVWSASANAVKILKDTGFSVEKVLGSSTSNLTVTRGGSQTNTAGQIVGGFAGQTGQGAGIAYSMNQGGASGTTVSGVAAFKR